MLALQQKLKQAGLRVTRPRLAILSLWAQQSKNLSVKQIYRHLNLQQQQLSLATVYRVVRDLLEAGLLVSYPFHRAGTTFNLATLSHQQVMQIHCADLTSAKQAQLLGSLETVFNQCQIDLMQVEIKERA